MHIDMSSPDITSLEIAAVNEVLQTRRLSLGPRLEGFEDAVATYTQARFAVGVNSGTSGLHLAMIACGIRPGDEVITTSFSFIASANCIVYERGTPVFVDVDSRTGNIDPEQIAAAITPRTRAIVVVDAFGQPADIDPIMDIARRHGLYVIHDACESIGAEYKDRRARVAHASVYAFYPNKQITTGEGGMITTDDPDWAALFKSLRNQGRDVFNGHLEHNRLGYNYRLDEMSAALGAVQVQRLDDILERRAQVARWYDERISAIPGVYRPSIAATTTRMSWFVYVVRFARSIDRDGMIAYLQKRGIPSRAYFNPIHLQPYYRQFFDYKRGDLPVTESLGDTSLALPFSSVMTQEQVDYVCFHLKLGVEKHILAHTTP